MAEIVYSLCFITSAICAALLLRSWSLNRTRLLLWSAVAFVFLAINNFFVVADLVLFPDANLVPYRHTAALAAVCAMIYSFIGEVE